MYWKASRNLLIAAATIAAVVALAAACGPSFPNTLLFDSDAELLSAPVGEFEFELQRIIPATDAKLRAKLPGKSKGRGRKSQYEQTAEVDLADLAAALKSAGTPDHATKRILAAYTSARQTLRRHAMAVGDDREEGETPPRVCPVVSIPDGLPGEFADYFRGAIAYHQGRTVAARAAWRALLARPVGQRQYRSTWAAFMLGRSWQKADPKEAIGWFARTREEAAAGRADNLGLAVASLGWQGRAELDRKRYTHAIDLYWRQHAAGDPAAAMSLRAVAAEIAWADQTVRIAAARHGRSRCVVTAFLIARGGPAVNRISAPRGDGVAAWCRAIQARGCRQGRRRRPTGPGGLSGRSVRVGRALGQAGRRRSAAGAVDWRQVATASRQVRQSRRSDGSGGPRFPCRRDLAGRGGHGQYPDR